MHSIRFITAALLAATTLPACHAHVTGPDGQQPATYDIVFESYDNALSNQTELFILRDGESSRVRIFPTYMSAAQPASTASGDRLAYIAPGLDASEMALWTAQADGSAPRLLPTSPGIIGSPAFSPDGRSIAYVKLEGDGVSRIWTIGSDGSGEQRLLANLPDAPAVGRDPAWSPDGRRIAFSGGAPGHLAVWVVDADGRNLTRLTNSSVSDVEPTWSPDGKQIAFARTTSPALGDIVILDLASRVERPLNLPSSNRQPAWSPDGKRIVFAARPTGGEDDELYIIRPDGTGLTRLTDNDVRDRRPVWLKR
jgi:TolB protein